MERYVLATVLTPIVILLLVIGEYLEEIVSLCLLGGAWFICWKVVFSFLGGA
jgi:hypothetical protein